MAPGSRVSLGRRVLTGLAVCLVAGCTAYDADGPEASASVRAAHARYERAIVAARATIQNSAGVRAGHEDEDRQQGELFLRSIVDASVTMAVIDTPEHPLMALVPHPDARLGFNNPDNLYYASRFSDAGSYVVSGQRGLARTFVVQALRGLPGLTDAKGDTLAFLTGRDLSVAEDGSFRITLSARRPESGDWLPLRPGTDNLLVRFSFQDWEHEHEQPGAITIRRVGGAPSSELEITPRVAAAMLRDAATSIEEQAAMYSRSFELALRGGKNRLLGPNPADSTQGTASHQWNLIGLFEIEPDQALVATLRDAPQARYHNFEVANAWLNTFEFFHHQSSLNRSQVRVDADGRIRYVVSAVDPGVPNWIDTTGATHGWIWSRWQEVDGELGDDYAARVDVVDVASLREHLPPDTPVVTPRQRERALARRAAQLRRRFEHADPALPEVLRRLHAVEAWVGHPLAGHGIDGRVDSDPQLDARAGSGSRARADLELPPATRPVLGSDEPFPDGDADQLGRLVDAELLHDPGAVGIHRAR